MTHLISNEITSFIGLLQSDIPHYERVIPLGNSLRMNFVRVKF